jgi:hypothetical protein
MPDDQFERALLDMAIVELLHSRTASATKQNAPSSGLRHGTLVDGPSTTAQSQRKTVADLSEWHWRSNRWHGGAISKSLLPEWSLPSIMELKL